MKNLITGRSFSLLVAVGLLNIFFFRNWDGLGASFLLTIFYLLVTFNQWSFLRTQLTERWFLLTSSVFLLSLATLIFRASDVVQNVSFMSANFALLLYWNFLQTGSTKLSSALEFLLTPITAAKHYFLGLIRLFSSRKEAQNSQKNTFFSQQVKSVVLGIVISIPILALVSALLSAGDPIFQTFLKEVLDISLNLNQQLAQRLLWSLILLVILAPFTVMKLGKPFQSPLAVISRFSLNTEISIVVGLLVALLGSFIIVQWRYIFVSVAAETDLSQYGVATYSEYVTRGFAELLFVSLILYSVSWVGLTFYRFHKHLPSARWLRFLQIVLLAEFVIFLASILRRVWLYQAFHGMTLVRAYGGFFVCLVAIFALTLAGRHVTKGQFPWIKVEVGALIVALLLFSTFNIEHYIATSHPPTVNGRVDHLYLARLSSDGSAGWQRALDYAEDVLQNPELDSTETITSDQRREIAYAGSVVQMLQFNREFLTRQYGSQAEIKAYYLASLDNSDQRFTDTIEFLVTLIPEERESDRPSATASALLADREAVRLLRHKIEQLDTTIPDTIMPMTTLFFYSRNRDCTYQSCFINYYQWEEYTLTEKKFDRVEQILTFNLIGYQLYRELDSVLPHQQLLSLEDRYFDLQDKISRQPEDEQDFKTDVKFYSPFLRSL